MRALVRLFAARRSWWLLGGLILGACAAEPRVEPPREPAPSFDLRPLAYEQLIGWRADDPRAASERFLGLIQAARGLTAPRPSL